MTGTGGMGLTRRTYAQDVARGVRYVSGPGEPVNLGQLGKACATVAVMVYHAPVAKARPKPPKPTLVRTPVLLGPRCDLCGILNPRACNHARCPIPCRPSFTSLDLARES